MRILVLFIFLCFALGSENVSADTKVQMSGTQAPLRMVTPVRMEAIKFKPLTQVKINKKNPRPVAPVETHSGINHHQSTRARSEGCPGSWRCHCRCRASRRSR